MPESPRSNAELSELSLHFDYPVVFTSGVFAPGNSALIDAIARKEPARRHRVLFTVERAVVEAHPDLSARITAWAKANAARVELAGDTIVDEGGEISKASMDRPLAIAERLNALGIDRQSFVIIAGGGAFLDMVGFAAAMTHRGVRIVRIPTTVLSQADSGVGVKNGINAFGKKNFLGTFAPPFAVINDRELLSTLPRRDRIAGMSEAVKVALIRDASFFEWIAAHAKDLGSAAGAGANGALDTLIARSARLHARHIATAGDPFELGTARPLDFGHWAAHKLESLTDYDMRHGEAVAIGIALDSFYSVECGFIDRKALKPIIELLENLGFRLWDDHLDMKTASGEHAILEGIRDFREHLGGELTVTLLADIGRGFEAHALEPRVIAEAITWLRASART